MHNQATRPLILPLLLLAAQGAALAQTTTDQHVYYVPGHKGDAGFARAVAGLGDVNGDGVPDFIVGGSDVNYRGSVRIYSGKDGRLLKQFSGCGHGEKRGLHASGLGRASGHGAVGVAGCS